MMGLQIFVWMFAAPVVSAEFELLGHGVCLSSNFTEFERFRAEFHNLYVNNLTECACPQCSDLCQATPECIGYQFNCCIIGERCIVEANVLFSQGTRPENKTIPSWSTRGYNNGTTAGPDFPGTGYIQHLGEEELEFSCFRKVCKDEVV